MIDHFVFHDLWKNRGFRLSAMTIVWSHLYTMQTAVAQIVAQTVRDYIFSSKCVFRAYCHINMKVMNICYAIKVFVGFYFTITATISLKITQNKRVFAFIQNAPLSHITRRRSCSSYYKHLSYIDCKSVTKSQHCIIYRVYKKNWTDLKLLSISQNTYLYPVFYIYSFFGYL